MESPLVPERVEPLLRGSFGRPYLYHRACESTQRLLGPELPEGAVAVCDEQTVGRGRLGRTWEAPTGRALLCSVLLRPPPDRRAQELSLVGGLATARAVERASGGQARVKWPNDVLVGGRKVAGVLAEASRGSVVLGVGVNVNQTTDELPVGTKVPAGSLLAADGVRRDRAELLADLLAELERSYALWREDGLTPLLPALAARDALAGRRLAIGGAEGVGAGLDEQGRLLVETAAGTRTFESGEVDFS